MTALPLTPARGYRSLPRGEAVASALLRLLDGPATSADLRELLGVDQRRVRRILAEVEAGGWPVARSHDSGGQAGVTYSVGVPDALVGARRLAAEVEANRALRAELARALHRLRERDEMIGRLRAGAVA